MSVFYSQGINSQTLGTDNDEINIFCMHRCIESESIPMIGYMPWQDVCLIIFLSKTSLLKSGLLQYMQSTMTIGRRSDTKHLSL